MSEEAGYNYKFLTQAEKKGQIEFKRICRLIPPTELEVGEQEFDEKIIYDNEIPNNDLYAILEKIRLEWEYKVYVEDVEITCYEDMESGGGCYYNQGKIYLDFVQNDRKYKVNVALFKLLKQQYGNDPQVEPVNYGWHIFKNADMINDVWYEMEMFGSQFNELYRNYSLYIKFIDDYTVQFRLDFIVTMDLLDFINGQNIQNNDRYLKQSIEDLEQLQDASTNGDTVFDKEKSISVVVDVQYKLEVPTDVLINIPPTERPTLELVRGCGTVDMFCRWYDSPLSEITEPVWELLDSNDNTISGFISNEDIKISLKRKIIDISLMDSFIECYGIILINNENNIINFVTNYEEFRKIIVESGALPNNAEILTTPISKNYASLIYTTILTVNYKLLQSNAKYRIFAINYFRKLNNQIDINTFLSPIFEITDVKGVADELGYSGNIKTYTEVFASNNVEGLIAGERLLNTIKIDYSDDKLKNALTNILGVSNPSNNIANYIQSVELIIYSEIIGRSGTLRIEYIKKLITLAEDYSPLTSNDDLGRLGMFIGGNILAEDYSPLTSNDDFVLDNDPTAGMLTISYLWRTLTDDNEQLGVFLNGNKITNNIGAINDMQNKEVKAEFLITLKHPANKYLDTEIIRIAQRMKFADKTQTQTAEQITHPYYDCCDYEYIAQVRMPYVTEQPMTLITLINDNNVLIQEHDNLMGQLNELTNNNVEVIQDFQQDGTDAVAEVKISFKDYINKDLDIIYIAKPIIE